MSTPAQSYLCPEKMPPPGLEAVERMAKRGVETRPRALVIDDERIIADTIAEVLSLSGFDAVAVYSGRTALEEARAQCPHVVISDVVMPGLNGIETAKRLLAHCPSVKVLLLSGQAATEEMIQQARAQGFTFELMAKPLHPDDLIAHLRRLGF